MITGRMMPLARAYRVQSSARVQRKVAHVKCVGVSLSRHARAAPTLRPCRRDTLDSSLRSLEMSGQGFSGRLWICLHGHAHAIEEWKELQTHLQVRALSFLYPCF